MKHHWADWGMILFISAFTAVLAYALWQAMIDSKLVVPLIVFVLMFRRMYQWLNDSTGESDENND